MQISALVYVSMSELALAMPDITYDWVEKNPDEFRKILFDMGMDVNVPWDTQFNVQHTNRLGKKVVSDRFVGNERIDADWIKSGYATQAAIDKSTGNRMLVDIYALRGEVE